MARGECPAPLHNRNLCAKGRKTPTENHWPSRLGVGVVVIALASHECGPCWAPSSDHMWDKFVVLASSERFFSVFPFSSKAIQFDQMQDLPENPLR